MTTHASDTETHGTNAIHTPTDKTAASTQEPTELRCPACGHPHTQQDWEYRSGNCHACGAVLNIPGNVWKPDLKPLTLEQVQKLFTPDELRVLAELQKDKAPKVPLPPEPKLTPEQEKQKAAFGSWKPGPPFEAERQVLIETAVKITEKLERAKFDPPPVDEKAEKGEGVQVPDDVQVSEEQVSSPSKRKH